MHALVSRLPCFCLLLALLAVAAGTGFAQVDPRLTSWLTTYSGQYARIVETDAELLTGTVKTTWTRGSISQSSPTYCGVNELAYSANWVYLRATVPSTNVIDSETLLPFVQGTTNLQRRVFVQAFNDAAPTTNDGRGLRREGYKLIRFDTGTNLLYHLASDPYEGTNLLASTLTPVAQSNYHALVLRLAEYQAAIPQPSVTHVTATTSQITLTVPRNLSLNYSLWRAAELNDLAWAPVTNAVVTTNGASSITLTDPGATNSGFFYRAVGTQP
jgi:hypothetical protein